MHLIYLALKHEKSTQYLDNKVWILSMAKTPTQRIIDKLFGKRDISSPSIPKILHALAVRHGFEVTHL